MVGEVNSSFLEITNKKVAQERVSQIDFIQSIFFISGVRRYCKKK